MNFLDLYKKISNIDSGLNENQLLDECPCQDAAESGHPKQQDSVNMNVTINGQGANGIRDLMDILRNINDAAGDEEHAVVIGEPDEEPAEPEITFEPDEPEEDDSANVLFTDDYENSVPGGSDKMTYAIDAVIGMGDDLHGKGKEAAKQAGGGNPWNVKESLVNQLRGHYKEIKERKLNEAFSGHDSGDVIRGMKRDHDEWSAEKSAGEDEPARKQFDERMYYFVTNKEKFIMSNGYPKVVTGEEKAKRYAQAIRKNDPNYEKYRSLIWGTKNALINDLRNGKLDPTHLEKFLGPVDDKAPYVPAAKPAAKPAAQAAAPVASSAPSNAGGKIYHKVPFNQKDAAKSEGMRWDPDAKKWYHMDAGRSAKSQFPKI
jgi:hypothetical protein